MHNENKPISLKLDYEPTKPQKTGIKSTVSYIRNMLYYILTSNVESRMNQ